MNPVPYPADIRSKGWRFELDLERIRQSDTWALASPEMRPWLYMLWCESWLQVPCGSMPADLDLLAARIGMTRKMLEKHRAILLRGWWPAEDGRLYHDTIVSLVIDMIRRKDAERKRKVEYRARMEAERTARPSDVPRDKHGTDTGRTAESDGRDDTGTGTGTGTGIKTKEKSELLRPPSARAGEDPDHEDLGETLVPTGPPTPAGAACLAIRRAGIADCNPGHPSLLRLLEAGVTAEDLAATASELVGRRKGKFALLLATVEGRIRDAAEPLPAVGSARSDAWRDDDLQTRAMAAQLGVRCKPGELYDAWSVRIVTAWRRAGEPALQQRTEEHAA